MSGHQQQPGKSIKWQLKVVNPPWTPSRIFLQHSIGHHCSHLFKEWQSSLLLQLHKLHAQGHKKSEILLLCKEFFFFLSKICPSHLPSYSALMRTILLENLLGQTLLLWKLTPTVYQCSERGLQDHGNFPGFLLLPKCQVMENSRTEDAS